MFTEFSIQNLRGIRRLHVRDLRRINLVVGRNNSGKTTLLEAVFLMGGATNAMFPLTLGQLRGQRSGRTSPETVWRPLFRGLVSGEGVVLEARCRGEAGPRQLKIHALKGVLFVDGPAGETEIGVASATEEFEIGGVKLRYTPARGEAIITKAVYDPRTGKVDAESRAREDFVSTTFLSARAYSNPVREAERFSAALRNKRGEDVLRGVRIIDPTVQRIEVLTDPAGAAVYVDIGLDSLVPLAVCGEGFVRLFSIIVELTAVRGGVLLIDEIDNGLHYSVLPELWKLLGKLCDRHEVQILATTHNEELIESALDAFRERPEQLGLFRIDRRGDEHSVTAYDAEAREAVLEQHFEVRG